MGCHPQQFQYETTTCVVTHHNGGLPFTGMPLVLIFVIASALIMAGIIVRRYGRA